MTTTNEYLEQAKAKLGIESDYALAKWLEVTKQTVSGYKTGTRTIDDYAATKIAEALQINPLEVIAVANMEREKNEKRRRYWQNFLLGMGSSAVILLSLSLLPIDGEQYNKWLSGVIGATEFDTLDIMRNPIRRCREFFYATQKAVILR